MESQFQFTYTGNLVKVFSRSVFYIQICKSSVNVFNTFLLVISCLTLLNLLIGFINTFLINLWIFLGDNVDCWMEIQHGKGPWAPPVSGIVPLGSTLTLVVAINDYRGKFQYKKIQTLYSL